MSMASFEVPILGEKKKDQLPLSAFVVATCCVSEVVVMRAQMGVTTDIDVLAGTFDAMCQSLSGKVIPDDMIGLLNKAVEMFMAAHELIRQAQMTKKLQEMKGTPDE